MLDDLLRFLSTHGEANVAWEIIGAHQPGEVVTFEIKFYELGFVLARETLFKNGFNDSDAMTGVKNTIALINSDNILLVLLRKCSF